MAGGYTDIPKAMFIRFNLKTKYLSLKICIYDVNHFGH